MSPVQERSVFLWGIEGEMGEMSRRSPGGEEGRSPSQEKDVGHHKGSPRRLPEIKKKQKRSSRRTKERGKSGDKEKKKKKRCI